MGFFGAMGKALKAPLKPINKAVGQIPGMNKVAGAMGKAAPPGMNAMNKGLGIGPTPNPSGGGMGKLAMMGQMNRPPQALPQLPPMQQDQGMAQSPMDMPTMQPLPYAPPPDMNQDMGGQMPLPQQPIPQMAPPQQMNPKQSMFMDRMRGKAARRMM